jgi:hypothetical protein
MLPNLVIAGLVVLAAFLLVDSATDKIVDAWDFSDEQQ